MKKYTKLLVSLCGLLLLILPLFHMNTAEITEQENRTLAKFPETAKKDKPNYEFGKEFESWLGDRFWGRDKLIDARFQAMYKINGRIENDKAFVGDDGWMFMKHGIVDVPSLEKQYAEVKRSADILKRFDDKFNGKNIPIYLALIPDRNEIYQKYWERYYTPNPRIDQNEELIKQLADHPNIHIIYPKKEFMEDRDKKLLFLQQDGHLSFYGTEILIKQFTQLMLEHYPIKNFSYSLLPKKTQRKGLTNMLKIVSEKDELDHVPEIVFENPNKILQEYTLERYNWVLYKFGKSTTPFYDKNIYIFGNCYGSGILYPMLVYMFNQVSSFRINYPQDYPQIDEYFSSQKIDKDSIIVLVKDGINFLDYYMKKHDSMNKK